MGSEGDSFDFTGNAERESGTAAVHPMRGAAVRIFLQQAQENWEVCKGWSIKESS